MSFDWLNIPGLASDSVDTESDNSGSLPPPTVSFNFGTSTNDTSTIQSATGNRGNTSSKLLINKSDELKQNHQHSKNGYKNFSSQGNTSAGWFQSPILNSEAKQSQSNIPGNFSRNHNTKFQNKPPTAGVSFQNYQETSEDLTVPLSLSRSQLTKEEALTYLRWYNFITIRTHGKLVKLSDVFKFLSNFNIDSHLKERIATIFRTCKNALNIGQFFAVLRLVSKALVEGVIPCRKMILDKAPVPKPRPILNSDHGGEVYEEVEEEEENKTNANGAQKVDFDSFASLLLTGKSERKRIRRRIKNQASKNKRVRFSEHLTFQDAPSQERHANINHNSGDTDEVEDEDEELQGTLDFSLPMDQLLKRLSNRKKHNTSLVSSLPDEKQETEEEKEVLEEMKDSLSHFKQIQTVDLASVAPVPISALDGVHSSAGNQEQPSYPALEPLKPTSTGSANYLFRQQYNETTPHGQPNQPQSHVDSQYQNQGVLQPLKPTATGSANYLVRNHFTPEHNDNSSFMKNASLPNPPPILEPLKPTATGSGNHFMKQQLNQHFNGQLNMQMVPNITSPSQSPDIRISPQATDHSGLGINLQTPQPRIPQLQQQMSPQVTPQSQQNGFIHGNAQNPNLLAPPNPANEYFQSLLSNTPSPSPSNINLPQLDNKSNSYQNMPINQPLTSQSRASYNGGYQFYSPVPSNQPQMQQPVSNNYHPNLNSPSNGMYNSNIPVNQSSRNNDILGDLQSLQQQVDALQNVYGRR